MLQLTARKTKAPANLPMRHMTASASVVRLLDTQPKDLRRVSNSAAILIKRRIGVRCGRKGNQWHVSILRGD